MDLSSNSKRISIDLPENLIARFDQLRKEWGLRSRGPVIEKLLTEILQEDDLLPSSIQQTLDFDIDNTVNTLANYNEQGALVLIESKEKSTNEEIFNVKALITENYNEPKSKINIDLPNFVSNKVKNLKRSLKSESNFKKIKDYEISSINQEDIRNCRNEIINHWKNLYVIPPNEYILESSMEWFGHEIWPYIDLTEDLPFTWTAANTLMKELCPFWIKSSPSFDQVILMAGIFEDPFATSSLLNRVPTLIRRFISRFKKRNKSNSFEALDSTMTVLGALKLLNLSTAAGSAHTLIKIRNAYKIKALENHPDSGGSSEQMRKLNEAYQMLKNLYRK